MSFMTFYRGYTTGNIEPVKRAIPFIGTQIDSADLGGHWDKLPLSGKILRVYNLAERTVTDSMIIYSTGKALTAPTAPGASPLDISAQTETPVVNVPEAPVPVNEVPTVEPAPTAEPTPVPDTEAPKDFSKTPQEAADATPKFARDVKDGKMLAGEAPKSVQPGIRL